jgi:hypothetical protein
MTITAQPGAVLPPAAPLRPRPSTRGYWPAPYTGDLSYDVPGDNGRIGRAVTEFHPTRPGAYRVTVTTTNVTGSPAVGSDIVCNIAPHAIGAAALFHLGGGAGVALLFVTGVRRSRAAR